ncbi:MAG: T9SS C-terminal target domain-containing protein, partial [Bacteroidetes bacterium]
QAYTYRVDNLMPGRYEFRLKQVDLDGTFTYSPVVAVSVEVPGTYALSDVYPNPFNPRAQFTLAVEQAQHVRIAVYNLLGEEVALLHDGTLAGETTHTFAFEAGTLPSGLYLVRVAGERFTAVRQALLLK